MRASGAPVIWGHVDACVVESARELHVRFVATHCRIRAGHCTAQTPEMPNTRKRSEKNYD